MLNRIKKKISANLKFEDTQFNLLDKLYFNSSKSTENKNGNKPFKLLKGIELLPQTQIYKSLYMLAT